MPCWSNPSVRQGGDVSVKEGGDPIMLNGQAHDQVPVANRAETVIDALLDPSHSDAGGQCQARHRGLFPSQLDDPRRS